MSASLVGSEMCIRDRMSLNILQIRFTYLKPCLLYTSDAADELDGVDLGGRRIIKKSCLYLSLIHISEPTRLALISYAVFCLKKLGKVERGTGMTNA
ncbi:hypothetical protein JMUB7543_28310 [Staphylococcus aureus]